MLWPTPQFPALIILFFSGEKQRRGRITKAGNARVRSLLVQVALSTMRLKKPTTRGLWDWAAKLETKRGRKVAAVALARKTAGILYAMMRDGTDFKPRLSKEAATSIRSVNRVRS